MPRQGVLTKKGERTSLALGHQRAALLLLAMTALALGCEREKATSASTPVPPQQTSPEGAQPARTVEPVGPTMHIDPARAWQYVNEIVAIGPRWDGGSGQQKMGEYIHRQLKNDQEEEDSFVAETPAGKIPMRSSIAKVPGAKKGVIVLGSHIDTNYPLPKTNFAGPNDRASSTPTPL